MRHSNSSPESLCSCKTGFACQTSRLATHAQRTSISLLTLLIVSYFPLSELLKPWPSPTNRVPASKFDAPETAIRQPTVHQPLPINQNPPQALEYNLPHPAQSVPPVIYALSCPTIFLSHSTAASFGPAIQFPIVLANA